MAVSTFPGKGDKEPKVSGVSDDGLVTLNEIGVDQAETICPTAPCFFEVTTIRATTSGQDFRQ